MPITWQEYFLASMYLAEKKKKIDLLSFLFGSDLYDQTKLPNTILVRLGLINVLVTKKILLNFLLNFK